MSKHSPNVTCFSEQSTGVSETPAGRLIIANDSDGKLYEWFEVTDTLIEVITIKMFACKVGEFFSTSAKFTIHDIDGPIENTTDLRRSLRSLAPFITVRSSEDSMRYPPPVPIARTHR